MIVALALLSRIATFVAKCFVSVSILRLLVYVSVLGITVKYLFACVTNRRTSAVFYQLLACDRDFCEYTLSLPSLTVYSRRVGFFTFLCCRSEDSDWWLVDPNVTQTQRSWPEWGTASNSDLLQPYSWSVPASPQINRRYASSLTSSSCSLCSLPRTGGSCICKQRESFGMGRAGTPVLARSSAAMCDSPSPTREMRIAEFPESPTASLRRVSSTSSAARLRDKKMRSSVGTSDLTRPRLSFADSLGGDYEDSECREHFTLDSIMVTHKETKDSVSFQDIIHSVTCNICMCSMQQQQLNQYIVGEMIGKVYSLIMTS